jgi:hypothetical protein
MIPYAYSALAPQSIRLLTLNPGIRDAGIECHLYHASLADKPAYEALSYTWGDAAKVRPILLNGSCWGVTENLEIALRHLRRETELRTLWVDALSINQGDDQEKAEQVPRMRDIFASATTVLAWTGESSEDSDAAIAAIRRVGRCVMMSRKRIPRIRVTAHDLRRIGVDPLALNWAALWSFLERPFWSRIWVVQEMAACGSVVGLPSESKCIIGCGSLWVHKHLYDATCALLAAIARSPFPAEQILHLDEPFRSLAVRGRPAGLTMFGMLAHFGTGFDDAQNINYLLHRTGPFKATNPRDKVYALLGLAREADKAIVVDYSKPVEEVLMDLIKSSIGIDRNLHSLRGSRDASTTGPSWIPTLSTLPSGFSWANELKFHRASGALAPVVWFDGELLIARGVRVGVLKDVIGPFMNESIPQTDGGMQEFLAMADARGLRACPVQLSNFVYELRGTRHETFWRTVVMDRDILNPTNTVSPAPDVFGKMYRVFYGLEELPPDFAPQLPAEARGPYFYSPFVTSMESSLANRCFFTTRCGRMGIGPRHSKPDDVVVVLFGGAFCFVLRRKGPHYQFIGDAYVRGAMDGECVEEYLDDPLKAEEFALC